MLLVYCSRTNNIEKIVQKMNCINTKKLTTGDEIVNENFFIFTYTDKIGEVPEIIKKFLSNNNKFLKGVIGSGNKNFGNNFCAAAKKISQLYKVRLIIEFDLAGDMYNIKKLKTLFIQSGGY